MDKPANENAPSPAAAILPAAATIILTLLWGAYTVFVLVEIATAGAP